MKSIFVVLTTTTTPLTQLEDIYEETLYHVIIMSDLHLILEVTQTFRPDLLVLPEYLAGRGTHAFAHRFAQQRGLAQVPVAFLTGAPYDAFLASLACDQPDLQTILPLIAQVLQEAERNTPDEP